MCTYAINKIVNFTAGKMKAVAVLFYFSFDSGCCYINESEMGSEYWSYVVYFFSAGGCLLAQKPAGTKLKFLHIQLF